MRRLILIPFLSITIQLTVQAQNLISANGLRYGSWSNIVTNSYGNVIWAGLYEIKPLTTFDIFRKGEGLIECKYKNSCAYVFFDKIVNDSITVSQGIWTMRDTLGNLITMDSSSNGILIWTKEFDSTGNLTEYCHLDYESDTDSSFFYKK